MILKIFKAVWFLSLMGFMAVFMYIYASLPEAVILKEGLQSISVSRDVFFYLALIIVALVNVLVFIISKLYGNRNDSFSVWFFGQIMLLNLFFSIVLGYFNVLNSGEKFAFDRLGPVINISVLLILLWAAGWPVYSLWKKFLSKPAV